jgi:hypothetical protein
VNACLPKDPWTIPKVGTHFFSYVNWFLVSSLCGSKVGWRTVKGTVKGMNEVWCVPTIIISYDYSSSMH